MAMEKKLLGIGIVLFFAMQCCWCGVTEEQMMNAGIMMRNVCQPKFKLTDDVADSIKTGVYPEDQNTKCYINCILEMMQSMKKGKFNYESSLKQLDIMLPDHLKDSFRSGLTACKNSVDGIKNNCDAANTLLKCFKANIPEFTFP